MSASRTRDRVEEDLERGIVTEGIDRDKKRLHARIAWLYYVEQLTQDQIGKVVGMTRTAVSRALSACRNEGLVQVTVSLPYARTVALERELESAYGLDEVVVVPTGHGGEAARSSIGVAGAEYLMGLLKNGYALGVGWGRTMVSTFDALTRTQRSPASNITVVSLMGGLTQSSSMNPYEIAWRFAEYYEAKCYLIPAPVYAATSEARDAITSQAVIQQVMDRAHDVDIALASVGDLSEDSTLLKLGLITEEERHELTQQGAVGDLLGYFLDASGNLLKHSLNTRVIALEPSELKSESKVVVVSGGLPKVPIMRAVLEGSLVDVLVTDEIAARRLLKGVSTQIAVGPTGS